MLTNEDTAKLLEEPLEDFPVAVLPMLFDARSSDPGAALEGALVSLCAAAERAVDERASLLVLSDRGVDRDHAAIPSLLATSAVHHALARAGKRMRAGLMVETGEAREVADVALLIGYGAGAVNPYLAMDAIDAIDVDVPRAERSHHYVHALDKGLLKVMSKMGISCLSSYQGAQIFEAIGIGKGTIDRWFPGTASRVGGIGLPEIARESLLRHASAFDAPAREIDDVESDEDAVDVGGVYAWRVDGERHLWNPRTVASLQKAVRLEDARSYEDYARAINDQGESPFTLRGCWDFVLDRTPVPLEEVEPATQIVRRFSTGAMSFGSISREAHENLAIAMNRIGGRSNTGEGGEDEARYVPLPNGDSKRSAIKQVASARFGVTAHYLVNADEMQIKIAQGAKPGEGGQLPGHKVDEAIARVRHSVPGVTLISPPPHHDIYSIEDLAQLIYDLKSVNSRGRVSVKLVSETGVGTIAAGVAKAHADAITIAGHDGGTGASPLSSIQHAGTPWELGLAETHQVLVLNELREPRAAPGRRAAQDRSRRGVRRAARGRRVRVRDGAARRERVRDDAQVSPQHVSGRHRHARPGAPQARSRGRPSTSSTSSSSWPRSYAASWRCWASARSTRWSAGATSSCRASSSTRRQSSSTSPTSSREPRPSRPFRGQGRRAASATNLEAVFGQASTTDEALLEGAHLSVKYGEPSTVQLTLTNADRAFGARLAGEIARKHGAEGLRDGTIVVEATGTAGQSFGAFAVRGMLLVLEGDANDYVGKGLSGGVLAVKPPARSSFKAHENVIVGNTCLYGATSGKAFFAGRAGERFAVRNSGAIAVVEGVGDHGCEYMTGGIVVVLGPTGRNFAAGMSGGDRLRARRRAGPRGARPARRWSTSSRSRRRTRTSCARSSRSTSRTREARTASPCSRARSSAGS